MPPEETQMPESPSPAVESPAPAAGEGFGVIMSQMEKPPSQPVVGEEYFDFDSQHKLKELLLTLLPKKEKKSADINPIIAEKQKTTQETSEATVLARLRYYLNPRSHVNFEKIGIRSQAERIEKLRKEVARVQESASITINLSSDRLMKILEDGRFKSTFELPVESKSTKGAGNAKEYQDRRIVAEKSLGIYANGTEEDPYAIVGALASDNGHDEFHGGAAYYGKDIFVKLKPDTMDRSIFVDGDSIAMQEQIRGMDKEAAILVKAIHNIEDGANGCLGNYLAYVESNILGGVTLEDVVAINITSPSTILKKYPSILKEMKSNPFGGRNDDSPEYASYIRSRDVINQIKRKFPQYANLINQV